MRRRTICQSLATLPAALSLCAAGQPVRVQRVAWVSTDRKAAPSPNLDAFRGGLRDLGYREGSNLMLDTW